MTLFQLATKLMGVFLRLFLSARIGSEGMGLYQLIMSVYTMFSTFATAGFTVSVSRLAAEKSVRCYGDARQLLKNSVAAATVLSAFFTVLMLVCSDFIAVTFLDDPRCGAPLRMLALSMPFMAISACLKGWFLSKSRVVVTASSSLFESAVKMAVVALCLNVFLGGTNDIGRLNGGIVTGVTVSEMCSFLWLTCAHFLLCGKKDGEHTTETKKDSRRQLIRVTFPIGLSVWVTSILHTAEQLLIPYVFQQFSNDRSKALSAFGMIRGMVVPILFFPYALLSSLVSVFTPTVSRLNAAGDREALKSKLESLISVCIIFSVAVGGLFFFLPRDLGEAFYKGQNTETAIRILALVTPFMYLETVSDGLLKAVGEETKTLKYSVWNSVLRLIFIALFVTRTGEYGYLWLLVVSNTFSFVLCYRRLTRAAGLKISGSCWLMPLCYAVLAGGISVWVLKWLKLTSSVASASAGTAVYVGLFGLMCVLFSKKDLKRVFGGN